VSKPVTRSYSRYNQEAVELLAHTLRSARIEKRMTVANLAERAGMSRSLIQRIESGDMGCAIGAVFEVATILGVRLFDAEPNALTRHLAQAREKLTLLPKSVHIPTREVNDEF
jgi:transcriptional regulator with XRE-family HTH domain